MHTDRRIYLTTAIVAAAVATAITAFALWMPPQSTIEAPAPAATADSAAHRAM